MFELVLVLSLMFAGRSNAPVQTTIPVVAPAARPKFRPCTSECLPKPPQFDRRGDRPGPRIARTQ